MSKLLAATVTDIRSLKAACRQMPENSILIIPHRTYLEIRGMVNPHTQRVWDTDLDTNGPSREGFYFMKFGTVRVHFSEEPDDPPHHIAQRKSTP